MNPKPIAILMAEDDEDDCFLFKEAMAEAQLHNPIYFVADGVELLQYLRREPPFDDPKKNPYPGLIILDLNMPRMDGREALEKIKTDPALKSIPVVVMTTSREEEDLIRSYKYGANSFITKPIEFAGLVNAIRGFGEYWFSIVKLPPTY